MGWFGIDFKVKPKAEEKVKTFEEFFEVVQKRTGFFQCKKDGQNKPYNLFSQQISWLSLFDPYKPQCRVLLASRDKGKSEVVTILGSAWQIYQNPQIKIGIMSFKYDSALSLAGQVLDILKSVGMELKHKAGGYYADNHDAHTATLKPLGLMSTARGMHFDFLIMDDPLTINEQFSKKFINRSRYFMNEGASLSKNIILIGQLLTRNDLYYDAYGDTTGKYYLLQSWHGDIPELDKDLDYLTAFIGKKEVARNYLGYIEDAEEAIFSPMQFDLSEPSGNIYAYIDPSAKGHDYTAVALGWFRDGRIIIYGKIFKQNWGACLKEIGDLCSGCHIVYYEDNHGVALGGFLRKEGLRVMGITTTANKIAKIYSLRALVLADRLRLSNEMDGDAVMQVKEWTETAEHDDLPDAIAMLVQKIGWGFMHK